MRILFYPVYMATPHFETELELMQEHLLKGDEVFIIHCKGELTTCFLNPEHIKSTCVICKSTFNNGIRLLKNERINIIEFPFAQKKYPEIPLVFETIDKLKEYKIGKAEIGLGAASSLTTHLNKEHQLDTVKYEHKIYNEVNNAYYVYLFFKNILLDIKPDLVYLFNGRFSTILPALNVCEELNIRFYTHERGGSINKYRLVMNSFPHDREAVNKEIEQLWKEADVKDRLKIGEKFYSDRRKHLEHSWYSYTKEQKQNSLPDGFERNKKNIAFYNSTIEEIAAVRGWDSPINFYSDEIIAFREIFEDLKNEGNIQFYLRVHPNLKGFDNSQMRQINELIGKYRNVTIVLPESKVDSYALMESCDKIITFYSTIGVEACYWNKPCILLGKSYYEKQDCCYIPKNHQETIELIRADLSPKNRMGAIKYGYWELSRGTEFKHFKQTSLTTGLFLGKKVTYSNFAVIKAIFYTLISIRSFKEFLKYFERGWAMISK